MTTKREKLWPYKNQLAFLALPVIWACWFLVFVIGVRQGAWKGEPGGTMVIVVAAISILPLLLVVLDVLLVSGAVIDIKGVKLDFSKIQQGRPGGAGEVSVQLPANIGVPGAIITDSAAFSIAAALEMGSTDRIAVVNLKSGDAWWVTRLLVLCAGAVRTGSPEVLVFLGKKENVPDYFLGFGHPGDLLHALLKDEQYRQRYEAAKTLTRQLQFYKDYRDIFGTIIPAVTGPVQRYVIFNPSYLDKGEEVSEQILLDQLGNAVFQTAPGVFAGSLEQNPDRITINRLRDLFESCLYTDQIDLDAPDGKQIEQMMQARSGYVALVRNGVYASLLKKQDGEELILKELVLHA
jgi:hypothetical protein